MTARLAEGQKISTYGGDIEVERLDDALLKSIDGTKVVANRLKSVNFAGTAEIYAVTDQYGNQVLLPKETSIVTPTGHKTVDELSIGDSIACNRHNRRHYSRVTSIEFVAGGSIFGVQTQKGTNFIAGGVVVGG